MSNYLFISDAAKEVKVESHVLRYWEEELHLPIKRNELGHRYYTEEDVERFKQIKGMKERGLQLKAIKMILKDGKLDVLQETPVDSIARVIPADTDGNMGTEETEDRAGTGRAEEFDRTAAEVDGINRAAAMGRTNIYSGNGTAEVMENRVNGQAISFGEKEAKEDYGREDARNESQPRVAGVRTSVADARAQDARMPGVRTQDARVQGGGESYIKISDTDKSDTSRGLAIDIIPSKSRNPEVVQESREDKSRRLQWILQQLIRQAMQENNTQLCREIRESVVKELDYQFRMQEEREEARDRMLAERDEEHYKRMDEVLRKKSLFNKRQRQDEKRKQKMERKQEKRQNKKQEQRMEKQQETEQGNGQSAVPVKKKRHFI